MVYVCIPHHLLKGLFIPLNSLGTVVDYRFSRDGRVYFWVLNSFLGLYAFYFFCQYHNFNYYSFAIGVEIGKCEFSTAVLAPTLFYTWAH